MQVKLEKASGRAKCRHPQCKQLPEYINDKGRIKKDTTCAVIWADSATGWNSSYYCRDCIDTIHNDIRKILNPKLWAFQ